MKRTAFNAAAFAAAISFCSALPAHAQPPNPAANDAYVAETVEQLTRVGAWQFSADEKGADGKSVCQETWTFNADGSGQLISGQQKVDLSWSYGYSEPLGNLLNMTMHRSTKGPDCMGKPVDLSKYPSDTGAGLALLFFQGKGGALVCSAPRLIRMKNGDLHVDDNGRPITMQNNCWGRLQPVAK